MRRVALYLFLRIKGQFLTCPSFAFNFRNPVHGNPVFGNENLIEETWDYQKIEHALNRHYSCLVCSESCSYDELNRCIGQSEVDYACTRKLVCCTGQWSTNFSISFSGLFRRNDFIRSYPSHFEFFYPLSSGQTSSEDGAIEALLKRVNMNLSSISKNDCKYGCMTSFHENKKTNSYFVDRACNDDPAVGKYPDKLRFEDQQTHVCRSKCDYMLENSIFYKFFFSIISSNYFHVCIFKALLFVMMQVTSMTAALTISLKSG